MNDELPIPLVTGMADKQETWNLQENLAILLPGPQKPKTTTKHDLSEASLPVPAKWVRGEMGLSIVSFPRCCYGPKRNH